MPKQRNGHYIVFEGIVRSGKSTQLALLVERLKALDLPIVQTKEPGGDEVADAIRRVVQGMQFEIPIEPLVEVYLYAASRAQTLRRIVIPALREGNIVLADRSFFSSLAFQGFGRELGLDTVLTVNRLAVGDTIPDHVIHIDTPAEVAVQRALFPDDDRFETELLEFHQRCADGYQAIGRTPEFRNIWHTVDGTGSIDDVAMRVWKVMDSIINT